jgi:3-deoxy-D-manno-octulosonic acid kinase
MNQAVAPGEEVLARIAGGAMLYDAACLDHPDAAVFDPCYWQARGGLQITSGGRGNIAFLQNATGARWALRHYRRGGLIAHLTGDRYCWTGAGNTRSFREFRLLRQLCAWSLPVPQPVAARYVRAACSYRADLITVELPTRLTLAKALATAPLPAESWEDIGRAVGRLHKHGVQHADLNAHNVLLGSGAVYVLDFDRGRLRNRGSWERAVLARFQRSLTKVTAGVSPDRFGDAQWRAFLRALDD